MFRRGGVFFRRPGSFSMSYVSTNFELLSGMADCIAKQFGVNCEVVLHDMTLPYDRTIVYIANGHVTGRKIGDSGTNIGLQVLRGTTAENADRYNYINHAHNGRILRSSSKYFKDKSGKIVGSLCINFDITDLIVAQKSIQYLAYAGGGDETEEFFSGNVDELIDALLHETIRRLGKTILEMTKEDKVEAIRHLDEKGVFLIKKSADKVAKFFGVSKFTLYNYLEEVRGADAGQSQ
jgi:predicted transcriptional regulator YheO